MPLITHIEPFTLRVPVTKPNAAPKDKFMAGVLVQTETGVQGTGVTAVRSLPFDPFDTAVMSVLREVLIDADACEVRRLWQRLADSKLRQLGDDGPGIAARAAVDIALWDVAAQSAELPLHALLGTHKADGELWTYVTAGDPEWPEDRVVETVVGLADDGWRSIKIKVGQPDPRADVRRLQRIRAEIGGDVRLMADATGLWNLAQAATFCAGVETSDLAWIEEPCPPGDVASHARLARLTRVPIALGENIASPYLLRDFLVAGAVQVVQADATRMAGITAWLGVAGLAEAFGAQLVPHHSEFGQAQQHCAFATRGAVALEFPWPTTVFAEPVRRNGQTIVRPETPGAGTRLDAAAFDELRLT